MSIILIGPCGVGKTTVGAQLAVSLSLPFIDSDQMFEQHTGSSISNFFACYGEDAFRQRETRVLADIFCLGKAVIATGGGCIMQTANHPLLRQGRVCYLTVNLDEQIKRLADIQNRPLLSKNLEERFRYLQNCMQVRAPLYLSLANYILDTTGRTVEQIVNMAMILCK